MNRRQFLKRLLFTASGLYLAPSLVLPYEPKIFYSIPRNVTVPKDYPYIPLIPFPYYIVLSQRRSGPLRGVVYGYSLPDKKS